LPLLVRRQAGQHRTALRGLRGKAAAWAPAVTRAELIAEIAASNPYLRVEDAELIVSPVFDQITAALARGARVELRGFGAFTVKQRSARIGRNPRTHETVQVDEKTVPYFKAGREMLRRLNSREMKPGHTAAAAGAEQ
jgi:integration host factor subunit beta